MLGAHRPSSKQSAFVVPKDYEKLALRSPYLTKSDVTLDVAINFVLVNMKALAELTKTKKSDKILEEKLNSKNIQDPSQLSPENQALIALCVMVAVSKLSPNERKALFDIEKVKKVEESKLCLNAACMLLKSIDGRVEKKEKENTQLASKITPSATPLNSRLPTPAPKQPIGQPIELNALGTVYKGVRYLIKDLDLSKAKPYNRTANLGGKLLRDGKDIHVDDFDFGLTMARDILSGNKQMMTTKGPTTITQMPEYIYVMDRVFIQKMLTNQL